MQELGERKLEKCFFQGALLHRAKSGESCLLFMLISSYSKHTYFERTVYKRMTRIHEKMPHFLNNTCHRYDACYMYANGTFENTADVIPGTDDTAAVQWTFT